MNKAIAIGIPIAIVVIIGIIAITVLPFEESEDVEIEDVFKENKTDVTDEEIDEKIKEIQKIVDKNEYKVEPRIWQTSGPFQIDRLEYALGEKIFIRIGDLSFQEKGSIAVMRPVNSTHFSVYLTIPFDGANKAAFNYYLEPQLSKVRSLCSIDDVLGGWTLVFRGTNYPNLNFEIINKTVPGINWDPVC